jgi:glyoxylase-like metal-dependent hydrolase (beta-lactamase superfamily II)
MADLSQQNVADQIDSDTLRRWLADRQPVTILDVRSNEDRGQWAIPGSVHVSAEDALTNGQLGAIADEPLPRDRPVVTVCNAGRKSRVAAGLLKQLGFDARSLTGGMNAWSLAWNEAHVPLDDPAVQVVQVRRTGKGCLSYIVGSDGEAAVIDPSISVDVYLDIAHRRRWSIRYVLDTHVHADHLSRARALASRMGAVLLMPPQQRTTFPFTPIADGDRLRIGKATLLALHTPGHTSESTSFVLDGVAVFTGDTLFTDSVGRPDLHADRDAIQARARRLFNSLQRLQRLPRDLVVLPGHHSEPIAFDGRPVAARMEDVGSWLTSWTASETAFVERVTSDLPPTPANFVRIASLNEAGELPEGDLTDLEAGANRCAVK